MVMSLLERLNHAFSGGIMFVQPTAETTLIEQIISTQYRENVNRQQAYYTNTNISCVVRDKMNDNVT